jgi:hypothetical protein
MGISKAHIFDGYFEPNLTLLYVHAYVKEKSFTCIDERPFLSMKNWSCNLVSIV